mgnify:CR=1 FL=1
MTYVEVRACKAISTDVHLAARTVLEVGRFEKVTTALKLIPRLHSHPKFRFAEEDACVRAAWGIEPGLVAVKAVTDDSKENLLLEEAGLLAGLRHPCICTFYGVCLKHGTRLHELAQAGVLEEGAEAAWAGQG